MKPIDFAEANRTLMPPSGMNNCDELRVFTDGKECISKWKLTFKERIAILFGASVWMGMKSGGTQPPVFLNVEYPFIQSDEKTQKVMNKIWTWIVGILRQSDKRKHLCAGFIISMVVGVLVPWCGIVAAIIAGAIKEWWDSRGHGCVELLDFLCTTIGGIIAFPVALLIHNLIW